MKVASAVFTVVVACWPNLPHHTCCQACRRSHTGQCLGRQWHAGGTLGPVAPARSLASPSWHYAALAGSSMHDEGATGVDSAAVPGWASAGQSGAWSAAGVWARRLHDRGITQAQLYLVLDGLLPVGWELEETVAGISDEEAGLRLRELCRLGSLAVTILGMGANVPRTSSEGSASSRGAAAGPNPS